MRRHLRKGDGKGRGRNMPLPNVEDNATPKDYVNVISGTCGATRLPVTSLTTKTSRELRIDSLMPIIIH